MEAAGRGMPACDGRACPAQHGKPRPKRAAPLGGKVFTTKIVVLSLPT